ncbi:hypothetical protein GFL60_00930 [Rhizobium leguminosarum bv. viciae]|nr:hypothetical protein [Rhizobium leguminosarum bv. viciae]
MKDLVSISYMRCSHYILPNCSGDSGMSDFEKQNAGFSALAELFNQETTLPDPFGLGLLLSALKQDSLPVHRDDLNIQELLIGNKNLRCHGSIQWDIRFGLRWKKR